MAPFLPVKRLRTVAPPSSPQIARFQPPPQEGGPEHTPHQGGSPALLSASLQIEVSRENLFEGKACFLKKLLALDKFKGGHLYAISH